MSSTASRSAQEKANLARIRDNQRRSRARRKEYLQELESRVRQCEVQGIEASSEIQVAARRVADENRKLRLLLNQCGVFDDMIEQHLASTTASLGSDSGVGGAGQAVALLDELLQPRRHLSSGTSPSFMGISMGVAGDYGSRDSSVGSISTSQSSIWDQPLASVHSSSGHKRHRSAHSQIDSRPSLTRQSQSGSNIVSLGIAKHHHSNSSNSPIDQRGLSMLAPNQSQAQQDGLQIQSSSNHTISPANTSSNPSPIYDPTSFDFDNNSQTKDPFDSNNLYFQPPSTHSSHTTTHFDSQFSQHPSPSPLQQVIRQQTPQQTHHQSQPQSRSNSQTNLNSSSSSSVPNRNSDGTGKSFEATLMNTSSCLFATDVIRTMVGGEEEDVRKELGCGGSGAGGGGEDCDVSDEVLFGVMERFG